MVTLAAFLIWFLGFLFWSKKVKEEDPLYQEDRRSGYFPENPLFFVSGDGSVSHRNIGETRREDRKAMVCSRPSYPLPFFLRCVADSPGVLSDSGLSPPITITPLYYLCYILVC